MLKYKFNHLNQTLSYQNPWEETWTALTETFKGNFGSLGFQIKDGWMTFSIYEKKIRVFYKQGSIYEEDDDFWIPQKFIYYRKDLPKQPQIIFEFTSADQVEKVGNNWVKKGGSTM